MSHISIVFLVDVNFDFLPELSADQKWILNESLKLSILRIITGYLKTCKSLEWGYKFFNSQAVSNQLDRRSLDAFSGLDSFDKELDSSLTKKAPKKQASKSFLQRIDTTIRQAIADFKLDQLSTNAKDSAKDSAFEIWTITALPTHSLELYHALMTDGDLYEDEDAPTAKQIQVRTQKKLNKLIVEEGGLSSLLSKYDITAHFIDSRHILPGSFDINFGPGDEYDASKMTQDYKGLSLFKSVVAGMQGHVVPIEVMQYGSRLLPVLEALVHDTAKDNLWKGKMVHEDEVLNEKVSVMSLADALSEDLRGQWSLKKSAKTPSKSTAKKSRTKQAEETASLVFKGLAKQTSVGADWVTREQLLCTFDNVGGEDPMLIQTLTALHQRACIVAEVTGVESPFMVVLRPVTPLLAIVQPVLDKFKAQLTKAYNQKATKVTLETDKTELKKRVEYFAKLSNKSVTTLAEKSAKEKPEDDHVDDVLHGTSKLAKSTKIVQLLPQQSNAKSSKTLLKEMSDNATNDKMVIEFPAFKDLKSFLTKNYELYCTGTDLSHVERQLSACIRHAVSTKSVKDVTKAVNAHLFKSIEDLAETFTGEDVDVLHKTRVYLLQTIIRFELNTSLLAKQRVESSADDLIVDKQTRKDVKTLLQSVAAIMDFTQRGSFAAFMDDVLCSLYSSALPYTLIKLYKSMWLPLPMNLQELVPEEEEQPLVGTVKGAKSKAKNEKKKPAKTSAFAKIVATTSDIGRSSSPVKSDLDKKIPQPKPAPAKAVPPQPAKEFVKTKPDVAVPPQASSADLIALNNSLQQFQRSSVVGRRYGTNIKQVTVTYKVNNTNNPPSDDLSSEKKRKRDPDSNNEDEREAKRTKTK